MIYLIGVNHYVRHGRGPLGESFAEFLQDQTKASRIAFIAEALTDDLPAQQLESNASSVAKLLKIEYRLCDANRKERGGTYGVGGARADSFLMEHNWLSKIQDKIPLNMIFICQAEHVESFSSLLASNNHNVQIITKDWFAEEEIRRKIYSGVALTFLELRQLLTLTDLIARNAVVLNREFANLFGYLQKSLGLLILTGVNQLYEKQDPAGAHSVLSIPVISHIVKENAGKLRIKNRTIVENGLSKMGYDRQWLGQLSDETMVNRIVDYFTQRLDKLSASINRARNEINHLLSYKVGERHVQPQQWDTISVLIAFASEFYEMIGEGILGLSGQLDVSETLDESFRRLLRMGKVEIK